MVFITLIATPRWELTTSIIFYSRSRLFSPFVGGETETKTETKRCSVMCARCHTWAMPDWK